MEPHPQLERTKNDSTPSVLERVQPTNRRFCQTSPGEWDLQVQAGDNFNVTRTIIGACRNSTYPPLPLNALTSGTNPDFGPYLLDKKNFVKFTPADGNSGTQITEIQFIKGSRKMKHHLQFNVGSLTATNWSIYIQFHSDSALVPHPSLVGNVRIWFTDQ